MALGGLRDLSLITTAPAERLAIKTFLIEWHAPTLREAALRELRRGGQIYFVHNEVRTIEKIAAEVQALVPEASVRIGHGQMRERDLEQLMVDFYHRRFNVLVCTTIIESGIDVPTANTIIINRADHTRAGAAAPAARPRRALASPRLCLPDRAAAPGAAARCRQAARGHRVDGGARRRLRARHPRPGDPRRRRAARRAAERPDDRDRAVAVPRHARARGERAARPGASRRSISRSPRPPRWSCACRRSCRRPTSATCTCGCRSTSASPPPPSDAALDELTAELHDRFGPLPPAAQNLLRIARLKLRARALGVRRLDLGPQGGSVLFEERSRVDPATLVRMIQTGHARVPPRGAAEAARLARAAGRERALRVCRAAAAAARRTGAPPLECRSMPSCAPRALARPDSPSPPRRSPRAAAAPPAQEAARRPGQHRLQRRDHRVPRQPARSVRPEDWSAEAGARSIAGEESGGGSAQVGRFVAALPCSAWQLTELENRLRASGTYVPVAHAAWSQTASSWGTRAGFTLQRLGIEVPGLTGNVFLERGQFLHLGMSLTYAIAQPAPRGSAPAPDTRLHPQREPAGALLRAQLLRSPGLRRDRAGHPGAGRAAAGRADRARHSPQQLRAR